ncbi:MAG: hypothetical protein ABI759_18885 [Candidatus Solibacter sp.]
MKHAVSIAGWIRGAGALLIFASLVCAQSSPAGHWEGSFKVDGRDMAITLDLAQVAGASWIGSMGVPSADLTGMVVRDIVVSGNSVKCTAVELQMAKLELTLDGDKMAGSILAPQGRVPLEMKRAGEAKVELPPLSAAVPGELEGDWEGAIETPGRALQIILHFKNQADKTVLATIDTPDSKAFGLPVNDVKQSGANVEFAVKVAHLTFTGTMNEAHTQIAGRISHEANAMPLTLRKK